MITSAKNYTKKKTTTKKRTDRTLGQMVKAKLYRRSHTKKHTHTHSQKEKKEKNLSIYLSSIYLSIYKRRKRATKSINKPSNANKL